MLPTPPALLFLMALLLALGASVQAETNLQSRVSSKTYAQTAVALREAINDNKAKIYQEVDHRSIALGLDVSLRPSRLFIFGNPKVGARLIQCAPMMAIELPTRMMVREDEDGRTRIYWISIAEILGDYQSEPDPECSALAEQVDQYLMEVAEQAGAS